MPVHIQGSGGKKINGSRKSITNNLEQKINVGDMLELQTSFDSFDSHVANSSSYNAIGNACMLDDSHMLTIQVQPPVSYKYIPKIVIQTLIGETSVSSVEFLLPQLQYVTEYLDVKVFHVGDNVVAIKYGQGSNNSLHFYQAIKINETFDNIIVGDIYSLNIVTYSNPGNDFVYLGDTVTPKFIKYSNSDSLAIYINLLSLNKTTLVWTVTASSYVKESNNTTMACNKIGATHVLSTTKYMTSFTRSNIGVLIVFDISSGNISPAQYITDPYSYPEFNLFLECGSDNIYGITVSYLFTGQSVAVRKFSFDGTQVSAAGVTMTVPFGHYFPSNPTYKLGNFSMICKISDFGDYAIVIPCTGSSVPPTPTQPALYYVAFFRVADGGFLSVDRLLVALPGSIVPKSINFLKSKRLIHVCYGSGTTPAGIKTTTLEEIISGVRKLQSKNVGVAVDNANAGDMLKLITN